MSDEGNIWRYNVGRKRQRRQHKVVVSRDMHDENSEHETLKISRNRLRKGTEKTDNDQKLDNLLHNFRIEPTGYTVRRCDTVL